MAKIAMVTGATSGIGKATSKMLARLGYDLIITGRRKELLDQFKEELNTLPGINVLALNFDVRDFNQVNFHLENLPDHWKEIELLINNAGLAVGLSTVDEGIVDDWDRMIDTNVKGLLYVTRVVSPWMKARNRGHIVHISSVAGKESYPLGGVYCGTKHAVQAIAHAMRIELASHNIKVSSIAPGMVETEFSLVRFKGDQERAAGIYKGLTPLSADDIASTIEFIVTRPPHVNIDDLLIMPTAQASARDVIRR